MCATRAKDRSRAAERRGARSGAGGPRARSRAAQTAVLLGAAVLLAGTAWLPGGCSVTTGVTQEVTVDEALGSAAVTDVELAMGAGSLTITPGAAGLASGTIRYNVEAWKPTVTRTDASLTIKQGSQKGVSGVFGKIVNDWDLQLGNAHMRLKISAGAYNGSYDLSGLTLLKLTIKDGASKTQVMFNSANPGQMESLDYETGASAVTLVGLANANFRSMSFKGGAGSYSLDFSGQLRTDASVEVKTGAGSVHVTVPATTAAQVTVTGSVNSVSTEGVWTANGKVYTTAAAGTGGQGKRLSITVEMNVGSVTLVAE